MASQSTSAPAALGIALRGLVALAVAMGIGRFAFTPQLPLMQADLGLTLAAGGWLAGANYLGYLVGAVLAGRHGASATGLMRIGLCAVIASTAAMALPGPLAWWLLVRFIAGVASAWALVGTATLTLARLAQLGRPRLDVVVFAGVGTGIALAGLLCHAGALAGLGAATLWLALAGLALAGTFCALAGERRTPAQATEAADARRLVLCYGLFGFGYILPATYLPAQARLLLDDPALFGWVWPLFGLAAVLSVLGTNLLTRWPRRHAWAAAQLVMALGLVLPTRAPGLASLAVAALCVGGTFMVITLLGLQEARTQAGADARRWMAVMTAVFAIGQLAGPLAANLLQTIGLTLDAALWLGAAALLLSSLLLIVPFRPAPETP
ncbi:YbfB/YjiJ family MFS transporter [Pseudothauera nasutitermitis]|uniref:YbfB/YjiJ family MFS transporter n=1 Tax=Pseudothauera nasutitermitis TaxID=2565930 RepID=A0A4S4ANC9_9RHOO|nr:YbfB/YjiJ family MFS transporter [Pseudothauera nasutitermitis]THF61133.1 YbfB/YjiJ family MFS transporter [Pseudothauera nasutitermitis]